MLFRKQWLPGWDESFLEKHVLHHGFAPLESTYKQQNYQGISPSLTLSVKWGRGASDKLAIKSPSVEKIFQETYPFYTEKLEKKNDFPKEGRVVHCPPVLPISYTFFFFLSPLLTRGKKFKNSHSDTKQLKNFFHLPINVTHL